MLEQMNIFIINLESNIDRKEFIQRQLDYLKLNYNFIKASTPQDIKKLYPNVKNSWQRPLKEVEVACLHSHYRVWQKVINIDKPALILEDDVLISNKLKEILNYCKDLKNIDYINLESTGRKKYLNLKNAILIPNIEYKIYKMYIDRNGAGGYILYPSGARKLINKFNTNNLALTDAFIKDGNSMNMYQIYPIALIQQCQANIYNLNISFETVSNISTQPNMKYDSFGVYIKLKINRLKAQLNQGLKLLKYFYRSKKVLVPIIKEDFDYISKDL